MTTSASAGFEGSHALTLSSAMLSSLASRPTVGLPVSTAADVGERGIDSGVALAIRGIEDRNGLLTSSGMKCWTAPVIVRFYAPAGSRRLQHMRCGSNRERTRCYLLKIRRCATPKKVMTARKRLRKVGLILKD